MNLDSLTIFFEELEESSSIEELNLKAIQLTIDRITELVPSFKIISKEISPLTYTPNTTLLHARFTGWAQKNTANTFLFSCILLNNGIREVRVIKNLGYIKKAILVAYFDTDLNKIRESQSPELQKAALAY